MIEVHQTIDINQYSGNIKTSLLDNAEAEVYQNFGEISKLSSFDKGIVYVTVVSVYVDWGDTRKQLDRATLLKALYEAFSEHPKCLDILSMGSYIVSIFDTPFKTDIDMTIDCVGKVNAVFNLTDKVGGLPSSSNITRGVGMDYGKVLLVRCLNETRPVYGWNGGVIDRAMKYAEKASSSLRKVRASFTIFNNLKEDYQKLFNSYNFENCYDADPVNIAMNKWINANV